MGMYVLTLLPAVLTCYVPSLTVLCVTSPAHVAGGPRLLLPLRWCTTELMYYKHYLPTLFSRPQDEAIGTLVQLVGQYGLMYYLYNAGFRTEVVYGWLVPGKMAIATLAFAFDYLPHRPPPGKASPVLRTESEYLATSVISLFTQTDYPLLDYLVLYQNYHNVHHLVPYIPFYTYSKIWYKHEKELKEHGTLIHPIFGSPPTKLE
jgi:hypothetical protein